MQINRLPSTPEHQSTASTTNATGTMGGRSVKKEHGTTPSSDQMKKVASNSTRLGMNVNLAQRKMTKFFAGIKNSISNLADKLSKFAAKIQNKPSKNQEPTQQKTKPTDFNQDSTPVSQKLVSSFKEKAETIAIHDSGYASVIEGDVTETLELAEKLLDSDEFKKLPESDKKNCRLAILDICKNTPRIANGEGFAFENTRGDFLSKVMGKPVNIPKGTTDLTEIIKDCSASLEGINDRKELEQKIKEFSKTDEFNEAHLKDANQGGKRLFGPAKEIKDLKIDKLTQSLARLHTVKMKVTIEGQTVLQSGTGKTSVGENVSKLLTAINKSIGLSDEEALKKAEGRVSVLKQFGPQKEECDPLETTDTSGKPVSDNKDILALKLVTKECALIGIIPLTAQINRYSTDNKLDPPISVRGNFDQAESIDITRTDTGFKAVHTFEVPIMQEGKQIATVTLKMTSALDETTGKLTGSSERSNLRFAEGVSLGTQQHVLKALSSSLPTRLP